MSEDKRKDDRLFNCGQPYELKYVAGLYQQRAIVLKFLEAQCASKRIYHMTHAQVYELILAELGYPPPH